MTFPEFFSIFYIKFPPDKQEETRGLSTNDLEDLMELKRKHQKDKKDG